MKRRLETRKVLEHVHHAKHKKWVVCSTERTDPEMSRQRPGNEPKPTRAGSRVHSER